MDAAKFLREEKPSAQEFLGPTKERLSATEFLAVGQPRGVTRAFGETEPGLEEPWVPNPLEMIGGIGAAAKKLGASAGRSLLAGIIGAGAEYPIGMATEEIEEKQPSLALPFNLITGIVSGITLERAIERGVMRILSRQGIRPSKVGINLIKTKVKAELRTNAVGDAFTRESIKEINIAAAEKPETRYLQKEFQKRFFAENPPKPEDIPIVKKPEDLTLYGGLAPLAEAGKLYTNNIGSPIWDILVMQKMPKTLDKIPGGKMINRALIYDYRGNLPNTPGYLASLDDMQRYQRLGKEYAIDLGRRLQNQDEKTQLLLGEYIRGEIEDVPANVKALANEAKRTLYDLGKQAVELDMLSEETFFRNAGRYMPRLYTSKEYSTLLTRFGLTKPSRLDLSRFMQRKDIPKAIREQMGEILTPGYPVAKGITQLTHDVEMMKFFRGIADNPQWAWTKKLNAAQPIPKEFRQLPETRKLGPLSKAYVHPEIYADLQQTIKIMETPEKVWRKLLGLWKIGKIANVKTMARNLFGGNLTLSHLGGFPLWDAPKFYYKALQELRTQGKYYIGAREEGLLRTTWASGELKQLFGVESDLAKVFGGPLPEGMGALSKMWTRTETIAQKGGQAYQKLEELSKLAHYIHAMEKRGMNSLEAYQDAQKWLFDYGRVTRFQEKYRSKWYGAPFATFTFKALPRIAESIIKTPWRMALPAAIIIGIERAAQRKIGDTKEEIAAKKELLPDWMKGSFLGIPNFARVSLVDDYGREHFWNLTYWSPWGDIGEAGKFGPIPGSLVPLSQPFVKEAFQQIVNYDTFWEEPIVKETETAGKTGIARWLTEAELRASHLGQSLTPTVALDVIKGIQAIRGRPDYRGRERHPLAIGLDVFAGIKLYPVDYAEQMQRQISKLDPAKGAIARKIRSQIKMYATKRRAMALRGKGTEYYDRKIAEKIKQLQGLAKEKAEKGRKTKALYGR